jgi:hypothetical protein
MAPSSGGPRNVGDSEHIATERLMNVNGHTQRGGDGAVIA